MSDLYAELNNPLLRQLVGEVRLRLRDYKELNRLTDGVDHSDRHIANAIMDTLSDWKSTPPFIGQSLNMIFEQGWQSLFKLGCVIELLQSLMFLHMRNYLAYSDGGINVQTENPQLLQASIQMLQNTYEQKKLRALVAMNIDMALDGGGLHSEYAFVNYLIGPW